MQQPTIFHYIISVNVLAGIFSSKTINRMYFTDMNICFNVRGRVILLLKRRPGYGHEKNYSRPVGNLQMA